MYVKPEDILSPKGIVSDVYTLYDGGEKSYSIVLLKWDGVDALGIRWNGFEGNKGHPVVRGVPVWFIIPDDLNLGILSKAIDNIDVTQDKIKYVFISIYIMWLRENPNEFEFSYPIHFDEKDLYKLQPLLSRVGLFINLTKKNHFGSEININLIKEG